MLLNILTPVVPIISKKLCATCEFLTQSSILALACSMPFDTPEIKGVNPCNAAFAVSIPFANVLNI